jgi:uncharacterized protein
VVLSCGVRRVFDRTRRVPNLRRRALLALLVLVPAPTIGALYGLVLAPGPTGQVVWAALRAWIVVVPIVWLVLVERARPPLELWPRRRRAEAAWVALALSIACVFAVLGAFVWLRAEVDVERLRAALRANGLDRPERYLAIAAYITIVNSWIEEVVWRGFVVRRCEELVRPPVVVVASALAFTAHHVVVFVLYLGAANGALASLAVFLAGVAWSCCYLRYRSIWPAWVSHVVADAVGLACGYQLLFGG